MVGVGDFKTARGADTRYCSQYLSVHTAAGGQGANEKSENRAGKRKDSVEPRSASPGEIHRGDPTEEATAAIAPLVLIVDDFGDAREMLATLLRFSGYRTAEAASGFEAIEKAQSLLPIVILMDLAMPGMTGFEAARRLKSAERTRGISIIAVTGHAVSTYENQAKQSGCDAFIMKPVDHEMLLSEIRRLLKDLEQGGVKS